MVLPNLRFPGFVVSKVQDGSDVKKHNLQAVRNLSRGLSAAPHHHQWFGRPSFGKGTYVAVESLIIATTEFGG